MKLSSLGREARHGVVWVFSSGASAFRLGALRLSAHVCAWCAPLQALHCVCCIIGITCRGCCTICHNCCISIIIDCIAIICCIGAWPGVAGDEAVGGLSRGKRRLIAGQILLS
eukprot:COSAG06_NODE_177_length_21031_cov_13.839528_9_plen_113_part_00